MTESGGSGSVQNTHTYTTPGVYTITLTVNNSDGTTSTTQYSFVVAYDPNGGFVTGSGWINSPQGAYSVNPSLTGKATFGFNSKYQQGATVPSGARHIKDGARATPAATGTTSERRATARALSIDFDRAGPT